MSDLARVRWIVSSLSGDMGPRWTNDRVGTGRGEGEVRCHNERQDIVWYRKV